MDWEKLKLFHTVAEAGNLTHAAERLNMSQSALSRQIKALETELNLALFTRHARGLVLTQEGEQLYAAAKDVFQKIDAVEQSLQEGKEKPFGRLRITTTVAFGTFWLTPHLNDFARLFPDIRLELILTDKDVDLSGGEAEVAIRFHTPEQADLIQRPLVPIHQHIYAAPQYLTRKGTPERAEDLDGHDLVVYGPAGESPHLELDWILKAGCRSRKRKPRLMVNSHFGVMQAVKAGLGIGALPDYMAPPNPDLVRILNDVAGPEYKAYFVYPSELKKSKRINEFRDYLVKQVLAEASKL